MAGVVQLAQLCGWLVYHTHDARHSAAGFPDLVLVRGRRLVFVELKRDGEWPATAQRAWLVALAETGGAEVYVWHEADWRSGAIERTLRPGR